MGPVFALTGSNAAHRELSRQRILDAITAWGKSNRSDHPSTFEVPSPEDLASLRPGRNVKVCVKPPSNSEFVAERFSVELTEAHGNRLIGVVNNNLPPERRLPFVTSIEFEPRHVLSILT